MNKLKSGNTINDSPTIDEVGGANCPSLAGYWKCSDISSGIIPDHSGYGNDLVLTCADTDHNIGDDFCGVLTEGVTIVNGHMKLNGGIAAICDVTGTLLDTQNNFVIYGCSIYSEVLSTDSDYGTRWQGQPGETLDADDPTGFAFGTVSSLRSASVTWGDGTSSVTVAQASVPVGKTVNIVAGFRPSTSLVGAYQTLNADGSVSAEATSSDSTPTPPATLVAQNGKFGLKATDDNVGTNSAPVKDYFVWSFDSEPIYMTETVDWLSKNHGRIPPWWIGR